MKIMNQLLQQRAQQRPEQRGGFAVGLIVGLLIGLVTALAVALYVTKAPMPFVNKVPQRTPVQDAAEIEKNKNWDPNSALYGKNPAKSSTSNVQTNKSTISTPTVVTAPVSATDASDPKPPSVTTSQTKPTSTANTTTRMSSDRDPAGILSSKEALPAPRKAASSAAPGSLDPFTYFVQAGAYSQSEEAEQQRAKLAMMGMEARLTERDQSGRTMYRVRVGPFESKAEADAARETLSGAGVEAALVRVQR
jgi:cell division protein FtsN